MDAIGGKEGRAPPAKAERAVDPFPLLDDPVGGVVPVPETVAVEDPELSRLKFVVPPSTTVVVVPPVELTVVLPVVTRGGEVVEKVEV